jgi:LPXTG-site transpeptidase (sortase) family protein
MQQNSSSQRPAPLLLQSRPSTTTKIWQIIGLVLMVGGLALIGWGGWLYIQNQIEANKPPPARILEVNVTDAGNELEQQALSAPTKAPEQKSVVMTLPGQGGNVVFSGHHNTKGEVFRYLVDIEPGDIVTVYADDKPYRYAVTDKFIVKDKGEPEAVRRENAKWIGPFNEDRLTLVTCWPYNNNTHRLIIIGHPVDA